MKASLRWLSDLLGTPLDPAETRDRIAMLGAPVDAMESLHADLGGVVVGLVVECGRHPNADRLSLTRVDAGTGEILSVVCGAPNVAQGKKYPFAPVGTVLPGGLKLERRKIRGETSEGMLCSARELGLGTDGDGILELTTDAAPGARFLDVMPIADTRYEIDVTANRPDLLSHEGLARDLGVVLRKSYRLPVIPGAGEPPRVPRANGASGEASGVRITIEDGASCPRYTAAVIRGARIGPSPDWLKSRLAALGSRSINNVVDATNYLMFESGQPLHAFDLAHVRGSAIIVRKAKPGEKLTTLDGQPRTLTPEMCIIADAEGATGLAGVMGGAGSEISEATTDILLECAYFDPKATRRLRRALGMNTDASYRFERGADYDATAMRLARAAQLIVAVAGGRIEGAVDVYPQPIAPRTIFLRDARLAQVLGVTVSRGDVERVLTAAGCVVGPKADRCAVQVPAWRPDLEREIDLVEEVARLVGYDRFPDQMRPYRPGTVPDAGAEQLGDRLRLVLTGLGLHEAITIPLGPKISEAQPPVLNPLSQEEAYLRHELLPGLVRRAEHNWRQMTRDVRLFEIGHVFNNSGKRKEEGGGRTYLLPLEENHVAGVITGARRPPHWSDSAPPDADLFDIKGVVDAVLALAAPGATAEPAVLEGTSGNGATWMIRDGDAIIGRAQELAADRPAWAAPLLGFELLLREGVQPTVPRYAPVPAWPPVQRDVALIMAANVRAADIEATLRESAGKLLERLWIFDEYRGAPLGAGERSVAWRLVFRAPDRTLRDEEVDKAIGRAIKSVEERHGVRRREA
ncbi:MAG TPA: phenylalanine--tRNA ligase subunit beta [Gemmatimonadales bacterium]|jgi:phenylalanyl-tRNA synthetase beta chain